jgi:hypothetical protein
LWKLQRVPHKLKDKIQHDRHSDSEWVDHNKCIPNKLKLEEISIPYIFTAKLRVDIFWKVTYRTQQENDRGHNPKRSIKIWVWLNRFDKILFEWGNDCWLDPLEYIFLSHFEVLLIKLLLEESHASRVLFFSLFFPICPHNLLLRIINEGRFGYNALRVFRKERGRFHLPSLRRITFYFLHKI